MKTKGFFRVVIATIMVMITPLTIGVQNIWADDEVNTSMFVSPMLQELLLTPGEQYQGTILISNGDKALSDLEYSIGVGSYGWNHSDDDKDDYGGIDVDTKTQYNMIMDWIELEKDSGIVQPNTQEKVLFTINVPENAPAGAQYASFLVTNKTKDDEENNSDGDSVQIKSETRLASAIIANIAGTTTEKGAILENSFPSFLLNGHLEASSMVRNDGNMFTKPEYILQVWPLGSDEEICTNEEKPGTELVLPETQRFHMESCELPSLGIFRAKQTVRIFGEESILEKTIIVCPIWLLFVIFFVIAGLIIWIVMRVRARGKNNKKSEKKSEE